MLQNSVSAMQNMVTCDHQIICNITAAAAAAAAIRLKRHVLIKLNINDIVNTSSRKFFNLNVIKHT